MTRTLLALFVLLAATPVRAQNDPFLTWVHPVFPRLERSDLDGSNRTVLDTTSPSGTPQDVAVDPLTGRIYYDGGELIGIDSDGSNRAVIKTAPAGGMIDGVGIDPFTRTLYWLESAPVGGGMRSSTLYSTSLDFPDSGSPGVTIGNSANVLAIEVDVGAGYLFVGHEGPSSLTRYNLTSPTTPLVFDTFPGTPGSGIWLDRANSWVYYADSFDLQRRTYGGLLPTLIYVDSVPGIQSVALDLPFDNVYYVTQPPSQVRRGPLAGGPPTTLVSGADATAIALHRPCTLLPPSTQGPDVSAVYMTNVLAGDELSRVALDGSDFSALNASLDFVDVEVDLAARRLFVTTRPSPPAMGGDVLSLDLLGQNPTTVLPFNIDDGAVSLSIDPVVSLLHVAEDDTTTFVFPTYQVWSVNLDGSNSTEIHTSAFPPIGDLAFERGQNLLFVGSRDGNRAERWRLSPPFVRTVLPLRARELAIDAGADQVYFADGNRVVRTDYDASCIETVVIDPNHASTIALDLPRGHLYYGGGGQLARVGLDGSGPIALGSGPQGDGQIALGPSAGIPASTFSGIAWLVAALFLIGTIAFSVRRATR